MLQIIGELYVQSRVLQKMLSNPALQKEEKQLHDNGTNYPTSAATGDLHSSIESSRRG